MPLVKVGMPSDSTRRRAASSAWSAQTSVPRISSGWCDSASRPAIRATSSPLGSRTRRGRTCRRRPGAGVEELVHRDVDVHRTAMRGARDGEGVVEAGGHLAGGVESARLLGDRRDDREVVDLLQRAAAPAVGRCATADDDHRRAGELGLGDRRDPVGDAGPCGQDGQAGHPGQLAGGFGREGGGLFVSYVEQAHRRLGLDRSVVHREDVCPREGEHGLHAVRPGDRDRHLPAVPTHFFAHAWHARASIPARGAFSAWSRAATGTGSSSP